MYLGLEDTSKPNPILYFKIEKKGKQRIIDSEGKVTYEGTSTGESYIYSDIIQLVSETHGLGKYVSPIDPPSYTFIEDKNTEINYANEKVFSVRLTGFDYEKDLEELENSTWLIDGKDCGLRTHLVSSSTEDKEADEPGAAVLISDEDSIVIDGQTVDDPYTEGEKIIYTEIDGNITEEQTGIEIFLIKQEDGSIIASAVISNSIVPEGGNIVLTYIISQATRSANCFKVRNGSDGINIVMRSSSGYTLTNGDIDTELSVDLYYGMQLMNGEDSENQFYYVWKKDGEALSNINKINLIEVIVPETLEIIFAQEITKISAKNEDGAANEDFFKLKSIYITALDFGMKSNYRCDVFTSREEALREYLLMNENRDENLEFE